MSIGWNVSTYHRLLVIAAYIYLFYSDWGKYDPKDFGNAAVRGGGILTASSSLKPMNSVNNALLHEQFVTGKGTYLNPKLQTSWCANFNSVGEWIQVSIPKTEFWQGIKIAGNPLLGNYVTDLRVYLGKGDAKEEDF